MLCEREREKNFAGLEINNNELLHEWRRTPTNQPAQLIFLILLEFSFEDLRAIEVEILGFEKIWWISINFPTKGKQIEKAMNGEKDGIIQ